MFLCSVAGGYLRRRPAGTEMATAIMVNTYTKVVRCGGQSFFVLFVYDYRKHAFILHCVFVYVGIIMMWCLDCVD